MYLELAYVKILLNAVKCIFKTYIFLASSQCCSNEVHGDGGAQLIGRMEILTIFAVI